MAKTTIRDSFNIQAQMQQSLKEAGIENRAALDKLMSSTSIEKILADAPAVYNYFKLANIGLWSMIEPKDQRTVPFETPTPDQYREYFDNQTPQPTPYFNFIPYQDIFNPEAMGQKAGFKPEQVEAYAMILHGSGKEGGSSTAWSDVEGQGAQGAGSYPSGGYGGGTGKAMSTGGSYGGGSGKAMSTGGSPQNKSLGAPPPPPGMGGASGAYAPPPPGSGGGVGGASPLSGMDPSMGTQGARNYVDQNLYNDPSYGWFQQLFGRSDMTNGIIAGLMEEQTREDSIRQKILTELQNLDPRTPEGARRITMLNYEMQEINQTRSQRQDKMMTVKRYHDEFMNVVKNMIDIQMRTTDAIVKNMRQ